MQIGIVGTFDIQNFGDLLFPLVAEQELRARLGDVTIRPFSYRTKTRPEWPYDVTSVADLPDLIDSLDGLLIGGGFLIRFDKQVAPGYDAPSEVHHPTGYWLTPALIAQQRGVPVVWNAPGMHCNRIPDWAEPVLRLALELSPYVAVRDEPSRAALSQFLNGGRVQSVPDTVFGIARLITPEITATARKLRESAGVTKPYILIQSALLEKWVPAFLNRHPGLLADYQVIALPVSPALNESTDVIGRKLPGILRLPSWPDPLVLAAIISEASGVIGHSYHLAITALTSGVPVFTPVDLTKGKFTILSKYDTVYSLATVRKSDPNWFFSRLGKREPPASLDETLRSVDEHWDRVAAVLRSGKTKTGGAQISRFWQSLPGLLE